MASQVSTVMTSSVPQIVVTEPSPVSTQSQNSVSVVRKMESIPEVTQQSVLPTTHGIAVASESSKIPTEQANPASVSSPCSSGEFTPAQDCNECAVPVVEHSGSQSVEDGTTSSESDQSDFRTTESRYSACRISCLGYYEKLWNAIHSGYAIPFWLLLTLLPLSAGVMGALYMYSCPASHAVATLIFTIGVLLMAEITLRVCLIIHMTVSDENNWRKMLRTLLLVSTFLTVIVFITESVAFWKMTPSLGNYLEYCDNYFLTYAFWWNCIMSAVIVPLLIFPA